MHLDLESRQFRSHQAVQNMLGITTVFPLACYTYVHDVLPIIVAVAVVGISTSTTTCVSMYSKVEGAALAAVDTVGVTVSVE